MHRVKRVEYDEDELYGDEEEEEYGDDDDGTTAEDRENFATLTPVVRAELEEAGLQVSDKEIQDALWHYYWDVAKSVSYLKNTRTPRPQKQQQQDSSGNSSSGGKKEKPKSKFDQAVENSAQKAGNLKSNSTLNGITNKTETLKLDSTPTTPAQTKIKSKGLDVPKLWAEGKSKQKPSVAFVVVGHVDHGKSTLMGRLLLDTGAVAQREIDKYKKQAAEMGKSSFALAWVMDTGSEERERGVTVDIAQHHFTTDEVDFTILDAPGHRDFVPNMIGGASMADLAVLVIDANQLDSGMKGQTREHILLVRACGIKRVIVAVNKLDSTNPPWNEETFNNVKAETAKLLIATGFSQNDISFIPCSGLNGENVVKSVQAKSNESWVTKSYGTLLQELEKALVDNISVDLVREPLRMQITDVFRGGITNPLSVSGRIKCGNVQVGDSTIVQPSGEAATIKGIEVGGDGKDWAVAGELCSLHLTEIDAQHVRVGDILCSTTKPVAVVNSFVARLHALDALLPQGVDVHVGRLHAPGSIAQLVALVNEQNEVLKKRPRVIKEGQMATVIVRLGSGTPLMVDDRVVLRVSGGTLAAGRIESVGT